VSIGVGVFEPRRHGDGDGFYRAVDRALYDAKERGRNRVQQIADADA
jgi:GGDEF domain-containing protein